MLKESAHFILSESQLIRVVAYTFDVNEQQVQLNEDDSTCCTRFMNDGTITLTEIRIGNVNILTLDENKVNLLRDTYKLFELFINKVAKHPKMFIFEQMAQSEAHVMDVIQIHDETLFGNTRYNKVGLVEQVQNINSQVIILQNAPESYNQEQLDEMLLLKADKSELIDSYSKTEDDALLLLKANVVDIVDSYSKTETDTLLDAQANVVDIVDSYSKTEDDTLLDDKADKTDTYTKTQTDTLLDAKANVVDIVDSYSKSEDDALLLLKADKSELIDSYSKTEDDALLLLKADQTDTYTKTQTNTLLDAKANVVDIVDSYSKTEDGALLLLKANKSELIDSYSKTEDDALLLLKANVADLTNYVDLTSAQTITGQKQFGVISVSTISKQTKNDASILLAGGVDMLVSSLVTQPQLQEVRDIATGKSKAYVF
ncbi:MAG: hypothetical protein EZS28_027877 [Streblomastix strix]|uniref:Uncharacterized protein n=1 Tax=Streblomastix strix TaxID=222440 RepID=A0A5J4V0U2_9EUKA|nr:MAG: hypothetical protein EZS28_027877 [Streblomastix strix]